MEFGSVNNLAGIDFSLPPDHPLTSQVLHQNNNVLPPQVYVGCPIWACKEWVGSWYPPTAKEKDFLFHYTRQFNTIELNTTHYRIPDKATVKQWKEKATSNFLFCPKLLQEISHQQQLKGKIAYELTQIFIENLAELDKNLGLIFIQLPPYFDADKLDILANYVEKLPHNLEFAVEFRHESWFIANQHGEKPIDEAAQILQKYQIATIQSDVAGRRDVLHQCLTTNLLALRFVGNDLHPTDYSRTDEWTQKIAQWAKGGLAKSYLFIHEPANVKAPEMAVYWLEKLQKLGYAVQLPKKFAAIQPHSLF